MKRLICEMCGSADMLKKDGVFECQSCGCKYSLEEAKKMMVEGTVEVQGTVKVDNSEMLDNYRALAENAYDAENYPEAEKYVNKMLETNPKYYKGWILKGKVAAQTIDNSGNPKTSQCVEDWCSAYNYAPEEDKEEVLNMINEAYAEFGLTSIGFYANRYNKCPDLASHDEYAGMLNASISTVFVDAPERFKEKTGQELNIAKEEKWGDYCAKVVSENAYELAKKIDNRYYEIYKSDSVNSKEMLESSYMSAALINEILDKATVGPNMAIFACDLVEAIKKSYFDNLAKMKFEAGTIRACKKIYDLAICGVDTHRKMALDILNEEKERQLAEQRRINEEYWNEHKEEKEAIESEIRDIDEKIGSINKEINDITEECNKEVRQIEASKDEVSLVWKDKDESKRKIQMMEQELNNLGMFKNKEKKSLSEMLEVERVRHHQLERKCREEDDKINSQIAYKRAEMNSKVMEMKKELSSLASRKRELESELTKDIEIKKNRVDLEEVKNTEIPDDMSLEDYISENYDKSTLVQAIAFYKEKTGVGLKEAKEAVQEILS